MRPLRHASLTVALLLMTGPCASAGEEAASLPFPGKRSEWFGYSRYDFQVDGRAVLVVTPKRAAAGRPWVWRARFFGHEPQADLALLARGFHLVYMDVVELFGNAQAVAHWNAFHACLTEKHGFAKKAVLEGFSRGGLYALNWAIANPDKAACLYLDAPVCDFKSWPGGKGKGKGSPPDWEACKKAYGFKTDAEALAYQGNPIDRLEPLAKTKVPILSVCGGADDVVPVTENTAMLEQRYQALGGPIQVILKPDCGHHPHSLKDPAPIVEFILKHASSE
jgi:pimeloyl-ACP methyl ester carboxylesterase